MHARARRELALGVVIILGLFAVSCSSPREELRPGTPAYYWSAANETYAAGDYVKTAEHLENIAKSDNNFTARAQPWHMVLTSGMARAYLDLSEYFEQGAKSGKVIPLPFRRQVSQYRTYASRLALNFAEMVERFEKMNHDPKITLDFSFPKGNAAENPLLAKIGGGQTPKENQVEEVEREHILTSVLKAACRAAGAPDDVAKAQELFKAGKAEVPRETFVLAMANEMHELSKLYTNTRLDEPQRLEFFLTHAMDAVKPLPENKDTKALMARLEKALKAFKVKK